MPVASLRRIQLWTGYFCRWNPNLKPQQPIQARNKELLLMKKEIKKRADDLQKELQTKLSRIGGVNAPNPNNNNNANSGANSGASASSAVTSTSGLGRITSVISI
jgi:myotubularin-related protein 1/2